MANEVPFSKLAHDISQKAYRELHTLLDSLTEVDSEERKQRLIDFAVDTRHSLIRLLVAVRWHMEYSSYHLSASGLSNLASNRSFNLTNIADGLFSVNSVAKGAAATPSDVAYAAEVLGPGISPYRLPRVIEKSIDVDTTATMRGKKRSNPDKPLAPAIEPPVKRGSRKSPDETEPQMLVRLESKYAVRVGLPSGISVLSWEAEPEKVSVRIGLDNAWNADVILDSSDIHTANLRVMGFEILVRNDGNAYGARPAKSARDRQHDETLPMLSPSYRDLRGAIENRVSWAVQDSTEKGVQARIKSGLHCLCMALSRDCCSGIALSLLRDQVMILSRHPAWHKSKLKLFGVGSKAGPGVPLTIEYWTASPQFSASVSVKVPDDNGYWKSTSPSAQGIPDQILTLSHLPDLPVVGPDINLDFSALNVESLLLACARRRATHILALIFERLKENCPSFNFSAAANHTCASEAMVLSISNTGFSLLFSLSLKSGACSIRLLGNSTFPSLTRHNSYLELRRAIWAGEKHFTDGVDGAVRGLKKIIELQIECLRLSMFYYSTAFADEVAPLSWPAGNSAVEGPKEKHAQELDIRPPFLAVAPEKPKMFIPAFSWLTLSGTSGFDDYGGKKLVGKSSSNLLETTDSVFFARGKQLSTVSLNIDLKDLRASASASALWSELRYLNNSRFQREHLLRQFSVLGLTQVADIDPTLIPLTEKYLYNVAQFPGGSLTVNSVPAIGDGSQQ